MSLSGKVDKTDKADSMSDLEALAVIGTEKEPNLASSCLIFVLKEFRLLNIALECSSPSNSSAIWYL